MRTATGRCFIVLVLPVLMNVLTPSGKGAVCDSRKSCNTCCRARTPLCVLVADERGAVRALRAAELRGAGHPALARRGAEAEQRRLLRLRPPHGQGARCRRWRFPLLCSLLLCPLLLTRLLLLFVVVRRSCYSSLCACSCCSSLPLTASQRWRADGHSWYIRIRTVHSLSNSLLFIL